MATRRCSSAIARLLSPPDMAGPGNVMAAASRVVPSMPRPAPRRRHRRAVLCWPVPSSSDRPVRPCSPMSGVLGAAAKASQFFLTLGGVPPNPHPTPHPSTPFPVSIHVAIVLTSCLPFDRPHQRLPVHLNPPRFDPLATITLSHPLTALSTPPPFAFAPSLHHTPHHTRRTRPQPQPRPLHTIVPLLIFCRPRCPSTKQ